MAYTEAYLDSKQMTLLPYSLASSVNLSLAHSEEQQSLTEQLSGRKHLLNVGIEQIQKRAVPIVKQAD